MGSTLYVILGITALFFLLFAFKNIFKWKKDFCVICASVSITWIMLLLINWLGLFKIDVILPLLIGQSITGIFYLVEKHAKKEQKIFRLPFLLSLTVIGYSLLKIPEDIIKISLFVLGIWVLFIAIYSYRNNTKINMLTKKLIECCRGW